MSRTRVKICGITRPSDGEATAAAGADAVGLVFWPGTPRRVGADQARAIAAALPPFVTIVGLFVDPEASSVRAILESVPIDVLQFHGSEPPELCRAFGRRYIKAIAVGAEADPAGLLECVRRYPDASALLFDAPAAGGLPGGTGMTFDWGRLPNDLPCRIVLSGGLDAANVGAAIRRVRPWAVDVSSGVEATDQDGRPARGIKDPARIREFIERVRDEDD
jgi:phosphoribosylanthranilate isomerase